ncbi:MAG: ABC transporter substrate-binding protein [Firmicutes bacterium]|nr:ABC transporter substrate-binding protein [Bacillota bacterium]
MKHQHTRWGMVVALVAAGLMASTTGQVARAKAHAEASSPMASTIVAALPPGATVNWFFPLAGITTDSLYNYWMTTLLYHPLLMFHSNGQVAWQHSIVDHLQVSHQGTVYTLSLNPKWHWSNGAPVTSQDLIFTWHLIQVASTVGAPAPWPYLQAGVGDVPQGIQSITAASPYTAIIRLKSAVNRDWFIDKGLNQFTPLPEEAYNRDPNHPMAELRWLAEIGNNPASAPFQIVDGPFRYAGGQPGQDYVFVPNPRYSGHRPEFSRLVWEETQSDASIYALFRTHAVDWGYLPTEDSVAAGTSLTASYHLTTTYALSYKNLLLNLNSGAPGHINRLFNQLAVRQALQEGIDQPALVQAAYEGYAVEEITALAAKPPTWFYDTRLKPIYPFNLARGQQILERRGWHLDGGELEKNDHPFAFTLQYLTGSTSVADEAQLIQQWWQQEGIRVTLEPESMTDLMTERPNQWQAILGIGFNYGRGYPSGGELFATAGQGADKEGYQSQTMDRLIAATHAPAPSETISAQRLDRYEVAVAHQLPVLLVPDPAQIVVTANTLSGGLIGFSPFQHPWPQYWDIRPSTTPAQQATGRHPAATKAALG